MVTTKTKTTKTAKAAKATKTATAKPEQATPAAVSTTTKGKTKASTKTKREPKAGLSMLDAAAKVLAETGQPMTCKDLIETMATKGLWASPNGKTSAATLSAALHREIKVKGDRARFRKAERGQFTLAPTA